MTDTAIYHNYTKEEAEQMFLQQQRELDALHFITTSRRSKINDEKRAILHHGFEDLLNDNINLRKYVQKEKAEQIIIAYQFFNLEEDEKYNIKRKSWTHFDKRKELSTYPLMTKEEYKKYVSCSKAEALKILSKKTLEGISALKKYEKRLNFDWQGLNTELELLFKEKFQYV